MRQTNSSRKRLAMNTMYLYIRMAVVMIISLYQSRVLLKVLGVDDYGIYNLVGSIVGILSMLKTMFASATQRFLNYEMGKGNNDKLSIIFNMSIYINALLSLVFFVGIEVIGWWFFNYSINIDPDRLWAAKVVFQCSVITSVILIMTTTYDALVIAHEKMDFFAMLSILQSILQLCLVFALPHISYDRLIIYGISHLMVAIIIRMINTIYCRKNFDECRYKRCWDSNLFKKLLSFSGWQLLGQGAWTITQNGLNMLFNIFGGASVNAARGIAYQVNTAILMVINNLNTAITPYSNKAFAKGNYDGLYNMFYFSSKILFMISILVIVPLFYLTSPILSLWLGNVPAYTEGFVKIILIWALIRSLHQPIDAIFKSYGSIKHYQIIESIILSLPLISSYILLSRNYSMYIVFSTVIIFDLINYFAILFLARIKCNLSISGYFKQIVFHCLICILIASVGFVISEMADLSTPRIIILSLLVDVLILTYFFLFTFCKRERNYISSIIASGKSSK